MKTFKERYAEAREEYNVTCESLKETYKKGKKEAQLKLKRIKSELDEEQDKSRDD